MTNNFNIDLIAVDCSTDLMQFKAQNTIFFSYADFKAKGYDDVGGRCLEGPCPTCGGVDRMVISNGQYWCRQRCGTQGYLSKIGNGSTIDQAERDRAANRALIEAKKKREDRRKKILRLNSGKTPMWKVQHEFLMQDTKHISMLAQQGISLASVQKYHLGMNPRFRPYDYDHKAWTCVESITFPHFNANHLCINIRNRILDHDYIERNKQAKYLPIYKNLPQAFFAAYDKHDIEFVVILEGEKKAIVFKQNGIPTAGLWGINNFKIEWANYFIQRFKRRYVLFDSDNIAVIERTYKLAYQIEGTPVFIGGGKPDDLLVSGELSTKDILHRLGEM